MTEQANPCLPSCYRVVVEGPPPPKNRVVHAPGCQNAPKASEAPKEGYWPGQARMGRLQPAPAPKAEAPKEWDSTTVCFGKDDCPNCEREKRTKPAHTQKIHGESAGTTGSHPRSVRGSEYAPDTVLNAGDSRHEDRKPAPAPVSDKGAEVEPVTEAEADKSTLRILRALLAEAEAERDKLQERNDNQARTIQNWFREHEENAACNGSPEHQRIWFISKTPEHNDCPLCKAEDERDALRAEVLDLKRKIEVLESDRGKGCNPSRDPDHNDR